MKGPAKSLLAVKSATSQSTSDSSRTVDREAAVQARAHHDLLVSLVRLIGRQAAREWAEQREEHASTSALNPEEKPQ